MSSTRVSALRGIEKLAFHNLLRQRTTIVNAILRPTASRGNGLVAHVEGGPALTAGVTTWLVSVGAVAVTIASLLKPSLELSFGLRCG